jgi:hypothetical protein
MDLLLIFLAKKFDTIGIKVNNKSTIIPGYKPVIIIPITLAAAIVRVNIIDVNVITLNIFIVFY